MVATPLNVTDRFVAPETSKLYYMAGAAGVANVNSPTRAEMDAGVDLTAEMSEASGWEVTGENVEVPDGGTLVTGQIPGRVKLGDASIVFYASRDTDDVRQVMARGDRAYVQILHGGDVPGQTCDVYSVRIRSISKPVDFAGTAAQMVTVLFSILGEPGENVTIPAAA